MSAAPGWVEEEESPGRGTLRMWGDEEEDVKGLQGRRKGTGSLEGLPCGSPCTWCSFVIISSVRPPNSLAQPALGSLVRFTDGKAEAQKGPAAFPKSHSFPMLDLGHQPRPVGLTPKSGAWIHLPSLRASPPTPRSG